MSATESLSERILACVAWRREIAGRATARPWLITGWTGPRFGHTIGSREVQPWRSVGFDIPAADAALIVGAVNADEAALGVMETVANVLALPFKQTWLPTLRQMATLWCEAVERERAR